VNAAPQTAPTVETLRAAARAYERAAAGAERARSHRNALVRAALADGWTHAEIAEVAGLSRGRIAHLAREPRAERIQRRRDA